MPRIRHARIYPRLGLLHARPGGGPVLKGESSWRTVNGAYFNTKKYGFIYFEFRRRSKW